MSTDHDPAAAEHPWVTARPTTLADVAGHIAGFARLVAAHRDLVTTSVRRELEGRFRGTVLGWLWPLVHPVFLFAVYYFIFTKLLAMKLPPEAAQGRETALGVWMFVGLVAWAAFGDSLNRACNSIVENGNLIKKLRFPSELLPLNIVLVAAVTQLFGVAVFLLASLIPSVWGAPDWARLAWIPVVLVLQIMFTYGLALLVATLHVFLRDTAQIVGMLVTVWMFLTPVFWVPELPGIQEAIAPYRAWIDANPMSHLLYAWRWILMGGEPQIAFQASFLGALGVLALWAAGAWILGYAAFVLGKRHFADEV